MSLPLRTTLLLARSRTDADRGRVRLAAGALAFSGALVINAVHLVRLGPDDLSTDLYSNYVAESGLRPGLCVILVVLAILAASLAVQALRIGTAARERRHAALQLAGATQGQLRQLATADAALVGLAGGLLAGPAYLVLSVFCGQLPRVLRVFPGASTADFFGWLMVAGALAVGGMAIGRFTYRNPSTRPPASSLPLPAGLIGGVLCLLLAAAIAARYDFIAVPLTLFGLAALWATGVPRLIQAAGRRLGGSSDPARLLAGARLIADARPAGRLGALLLGCAFIVGALTQVMLYVVLDKDTERQAFYLAGYGMSALGLVLIAGIALASLTVGVADQLVDQRRQLACLTALGVDVHFLRQVVRDQIAFVATPALMIGSCLGLMVGPGGLVGFQVDLPSLPFLAVGLAGLLLLSWGFAAGGAALAGYLLRNQLRDALDPENLRAA